MTTIVVAGQEFQGSLDEAFIEMVEPYRSSAYGVAILILEDHHDAEDAVQEALMYAYRKLSSFRGDCNITTWLYRIVTSACLMKLRGDKKRRGTISVEGEFDFLIGIPSHNMADDPQAMTENLWLQEEIMAALGRMPQDFRQPIMLRSLQGLSIVDVAAILEIGYSLCKYRLKKAREHLERDVQLSRAYRDA